jgi:hypothetical protein
MNFPDKNEFEHLLVEEMQTVSISPIIVTSPVIPPLTK